MDALAEIGGPVLVVSAHEDEVEIHAGGTIARLAASGIAVSYVLATSGNRGTADPSVTMDQLAATREGEQRAAAAKLGVTDLTFLGFDDGDLTYEGRRLREALVRCIRAQRPAAIITHDPFPGDGSNDSCSIYPDHLAVGMTAFQAAYVAAPGPLFHPEHLKQGLEPWKPERIFCIMSAKPDCFIEVGPVWEQKWSAIQEHRSQGRHLPAMEGFFREVARDLGQRSGLTLAEGFRRLLPT